MNIISISKPANATPSSGSGAVVVFIIAAALLMSAGCGGSGPEKARAKLAQLGKDYSPEELVMCAGKGDVMAVKLFLDAGMSPNARLTGSDGKEMCALFAGCIGKDEDVVKVLVERGANPNDLSLVGQAPLWAAVVDTNLNMVRLLVDKGAKLDSLDPESGFTPLGTAAQCGAVDIMDFLLGKGAGVNGGVKTPLMGAIWAGNIEAVKLLLNHKPNLEIRSTTDHITAMDLARKQGFEEIVELLRNAGAITTESYIERTTAVDTLGGAARAGNAKLQQATEKQVFNQIKRMSVEQPDPKKRLQELAEWYSQDFVLRMSQGAMLQISFKDQITPAERDIAEGWHKHAQEFQEALNNLVREQETNAQLEIEKNQTGIH